MKSPVMHSRTGLSERSSLGVIPAQAHVAQRREARAACGPQPERALMRGGRA